MYFPYLTVCYKINSLIEVRFHISMAFFIFFSRSGNKKEIQHECEQELRGQQRCRSDYPPCFGLKKRTIYDWKSVK